MPIAKILIFVGLLLIITGFCWLYFPKIFFWFGHLPGDINISKENTRIFIPVGSMIVLSLALSLLLNLAGWLLTIISKMK